MIFAAIELNWNVATLTAVWILLEWFIRISALFIVPRNRKPSSATAWLMLIMFFPILGVLIFAFIGSPKLSRRRRAMQESINEIIEITLQKQYQNKQHQQLLQPKIPANIESYVKLNNQLGHLPLFSGNKVEILSDYEAMINNMAEEIAKATKYVHVAFYALAMDKTTEKFFSSLEKAHKNGAKVRVMFDSLGSRKKFNPNRKAMEKRLTDKGIEWYAMLPLRLPGKNFNRPDLRNHRKILVIDGSVGYTGSQNIIARDYNLGGSMYYNDLMARLQGPAVLQLEAVFASDWYAESDGEVISREKSPETKVEITSEGNTLVQILPSGPGFDNDNNLKLFVALIHGAKKSITITNPYFVPDDSLMIAITSAAQRGVKVQMINSEFIDQWLVGHAQRSYYEELLDAGVEIYWYEKPVLVHTKTLTIDDDVAVVGSSNLDMRSFQLDQEITLVAYDGQVVEKVRKVEVEYLKKSKRVHLAEWQTRSAWMRLQNNIARLTAALQ